MWRVEKVSRSEVKKLIYLPSAKKTLSKIIALGKRGKKHSAKFDTRQTRKKHSAKQRHSATNRHVDIRQLVCRPLGVCRVSVSGTRQTNKFAECFFCTQQINKFFSLLTLKLFLLSTYNMWYSVLSFGIFLDPFAIFN